MRRCYVCRRSKKCSSSATSRSFEFPPARSRCFASAFFNNKNAYAAWRCHARAGGRGGPFGLNRNAPDCYMNMCTPMSAVTIAPITMATMIAQTTITIVYQMALSGGVFITGGSPSQSR